MPLTNKTPTGPQMCDISDQMLVKVIARRLKTKAAAGFHLLQAFNIGRDEVNSMLETMYRNTEEMQKRIACEFVRGELTKSYGAYPFTRACAVTKPNAILLPDDEVFDEETGLCKRHEQLRRVKCIHDPNMVDRESTSVRIGRKNWLTHTLMGEITAIILQDVLGYSVIMKDLNKYPASQWVEAARVADVDPENWLYPHTDHVQRYVRD